MAHRNGISDDEFNDAVVYERESNGTWTEYALNPDYTVSGGNNEQTNDNNPDAKKVTSTYLGFGTAIEIGTDTKSDGSKRTIIVTASSSTTTSPPFFTVNIPYYHVFSKVGNSYDQVALLPTNGCKFLSKDNGGNANINIKDNYIIVGCGASDVDGVVNAGKVLMYKRDKTNDNWDYKVFKPTNSIDGGANAIYDQTHEVVSFKPETKGGFGHSVDSTGDGQYLIVGANGASTEVGTSGAVYNYKLDNNHPTIPIP
jgi:hypothetical protein